ncbi:hypothetical protein SCAR479_01382 [Seiridium cardinale]|uniref:Uncharacterized protein n=1 Tax=Seiridium cardinale TaxID=138064 RepID=A0ABR2Y5A3_9PEZI
MAKKHCYGHFRNSGLRPVWGSGYGTSDGFACWPSPVFDDLDCKLLLEAGVINVVQPASHVGPYLDETGPTENGRYCQFTSVSATGRRDTHTMRDKTVSAGRWSGDSDCGWIGAIGASEQTLDNSTARELGALRTLSQPARVRDWNWDRDWVWGCWKSFRRMRAIPTTKPTYTTQLNLLQARAAGSDQYREAAGPRLDDDDARDAWSRSGAPCHGRRRKPGRS